MSLEEEFHEAMTDGYRRTGEATGYWANYFIRDVKQIGGLATAKKILNKGASGSSGKGLQTLIDHGRADLSLEACVVSPRFATLFTQKERNEAQSRLDAIPSHGFRRRVPASKIRIDDLDENLKWREGASQQVLINAYERNEKARKACITKYGVRCAACNMTFAKVYGEIGKGFIHVHHIKPLAGIRQEYEIDPIKDLVPVCPNCHAMLHTHDPPLSVEELREILSEMDASK
jgi:5-methylcytosine-specific restriction protein A